MQRRLHLDIVGGDRLGDMLLVLLTLLGHVDHEIAENTRVAILAIDENLQNRIKIREVGSVAKDPDEMIKMKVTLSAGEVE